jgi:1,2-dihydroxy-3-keto-5-methylthiopentene dioxygenase
MTKLSFPDQGKSYTDLNQIMAELSARGIAFCRWEASKAVSSDDSPEVILAAYSHEIQPFMAKHGFAAADVINVTKETPNIEVIRGKFLQEHIHAEDEVRFFVDGEGEFWFHFDDGAVASLYCKKGDFLSVPAGAKHWFDLAPAYFCKAIRIFTNPEGWVAQYTNSGIDKKYSK